MDVNKNNLENALGSIKNNPQTPPVQSTEISKDEEIGFHKGALNTLANERNELFKIIQNVEAIMQAHIKRLEELGIKIQTQK